MIQSPEMETSLKKNTVVSCCHPALNQTDTYRSVNNQSAGTNADEAVEFFKKEAPLLVYYCQGVSQSISPSSVSDMAEWYPQHDLPPIPAGFLLLHIGPHHCFPSRRSTSTPSQAGSPVRTDYLCSQSAVWGSAASLRRWIRSSSAPLYHIWLTLSAPRLDALERSLKRQTLYD